MPSVICDLGRLDICSSTSGIQLQLSSLAVFDSSAEGTIDLAHSLSVHEVHYKPPWIRRGQRYRIVLSLELNEGMAIEEGLDTGNLVASLLEDAKLWKQLGLSPCATKVSKQEDTGVAEVTLSLTHHQAIENKAAQTLHRLGVGVPVHDLEPPEGIPCLGLDAVRLAMKIAPPTLSHKKRKVSSQGAKTSSQMQKRECSVRIDALGVDFEDVSEGEEDETHLSDGSSPTDACSTWFLCDRHDEQEAHERRLEVTHDHLASTASSCADTSAASLKRKSDLMEDDDSLQAESENSQVSRYEVAALVDAAIRLATTDLAASKRRRLPKTIEVTGQESLRHLSDIAPALWSPGYLPTISSRAVFLPTIAHAMSHSVFSNARSAALKCKLKELARQEGNKLRPLHDGEQAATTKKAVSDAMQRVTSVRLWNLIQGTLYDPRASRILAPLKARSSDLDINLDEGVMLEEGFVSGKVSAELTPDEEQDLLDEDQDLLDEDQDLLDEDQDLLDEEQDLFDEDQDLLDEDQDLLDEESKTLERFVPSGLYQMSRHIALTASSSPMRMPMWRICFQDVIAKRVYHLRALKLLA